MTSGYLLVAAWVALIALIIWVYRQRKAKQEQATAERLRQMLSATAAPSPGERKVSTPQAVPETPGGGKTFVARAALLEPRGRLIYRLLGSDLPDCEIMARVNLGRVLDVGMSISTFERDQMRKRIATLEADFLVCDRDLRPLAVIDIDDAVSAEAKAQWCMQAGIRYLAIPVSDVPKRGTLRAAVLGGGAPAPDIAARHSKSV